MKRLSVTLALTALAVASVGIAQTTAQRPADQPLNQTTRTSGQSTATGAESSKLDKQSMIDVCVSQVQVSNPSVPQKFIRDFCANQVNRLSRQN